MIGRTPKHQHWSDEMDPDAMYVFIPGALASGFLVSMALLVGDMIRNIRGDRGRRRRVAVLADALVASTRDGDREDRQVFTGLRSQDTYGLLGAIALGIAAIVLPGATWNFLNPDGYIRGIVWIWGVSMAGMLAFAAIGIQLLGLSLNWVPRFLAIAGTAFTIRFAFLVDSGTVPLELGIGTIITIALVGATWRLRDRPMSVAPTARGLLARTPLGHTGD